MPLVLNSRRHPPPPPPPSPPHLLTSTPKKREKKNQQTPHTPGPLSQGSPCWTAQTHPVGFSHCSSSDLQEGKKNQDRIPKNKQRLRREPSPLLTCF